MAESKLYKVGLTVAGNYVHGTQYDILTQVFYEEDGCSYVSIKQNQNVRPGTDPTTWVKSSARGASGTDGADGITPHIGANKNWFIGETDTGVLAEGHDGTDGTDGQDGVGLDTIGTPQTADGTVIITLSNGDKIILDLNHNHPQYYSKLVEPSQPQGGFLPDVIYKLGTLTGSVIFALAAAVTGNANHYFIVFDTGSTAPTITWPAGLTWADGSAPTVAASKHYEVSIMDGIAAYLEV